MLTWATAWFLAKNEWENAGLLVVAMFFDVMVAAELAAGFGKCH